jgi:hypothetical protein
LQVGVIVEGAYGQLEAPSTNPDGTVAKRRKRGMICGVIIESFEIRKWKVWIDDGFAKICCSTKLRFVSDPRYPPKHQQQSTTAPRGPAIHREEAIQEAVVLQATIITAATDMISSAATLATQEGRTQATDAIQQQENEFAAEDETVDNDVLEDNVLEGIDGEDDSEFDGFTKRQQRQSCYVRPILSDYWVD